MRPLGTSNAAKGVIERQVSKGANDQVGILAYNVRSLTLGIIQIMATICQQTSLPPMQLHAPRIHVS
jgi:hypothetical protein